jgi:hypothetical protein
MSHILKDIQESFVKTAMALFHSQPVLILNDVVGLRLLALDSMNQTMYKAVSVG